MTTKINQLLQKWPNNTVATAKWLKSEGVDHRLASKYVQSGWLNRLGHGAYVRVGSSVDWTGGVHALQTQLGLDVHLGAVTAMDLRGHAHYLALGGRTVVLFGKPGTKLPAWFCAHQWSQPFTLVTTGVFQDCNECTSTLDVGGIELATASLELAAFEMMHLVPKQQSYEEAVQIMTSLTTLRPRVVQLLLESCTSVKTKRLFMHVAEQLELPCLPHLDVSDVNFGSGRRSIHRGGTLEHKYDLVIADTI